VEIIAAIMPNLIPAYLQLYGFYSSMENEQLSIVIRDWERWLAL